MYPRVSGSNVVWRTPAEPDYDNEVFFFDGTTVTQLTDNHYNDHRPQISGSNVTWWGYKDGDGEIFLYDGTNTRQLTDNDYRDYRPRVSGSQVAWLGRPDGPDTDSPWNRSCSPTVVCSKRTCTSTPVTLRSPRFAASARSGLPPESRYRTAIRTATPFVTWGSITERGPSATAESISTPRFMGPG